MRKPLAPLAAVATGLCVGLSAGSSADAGQTQTAAPPASTDPSGIGVQTPDSKDRIEQYWTRDRMRAAKPMPTPKISRDESSPADPVDGIDDGMD